MRPSSFYAVPLALLALALVALGGAVLAENIDPNNDNSQFAYGENVGWINAEPDNCSGCGVQVGTTRLSGWMYGENIGWISMSCQNRAACSGPAGDWGVRRDPAGVLTGSAWAENTGWISFSCQNNYGPTCSGGAGGAWGVTVSPSTGVFSGQAWGENVGWITFSGASPVTYRVQAVPDTDGDGLLNDVDTDDDGDGIEDRIDIAPVAFSDSFSDNPCWPSPCTGPETPTPTPYQGTTAGVVNAWTAGLRITDNVGNGVHVANLGQGTAEVTGSGPGNLCLPRARLQVGPGKEYDLACRSTDINVVAGPLDVDFQMGDGTTIPGSLPTGAHIEATEPSPGVMDVTNALDSTSSVVVGGLTIPAGQTATGLTDTDEDGVVDQVDTDDDNDGFTDDVEGGAPLCAGSANDDAPDDAVINDGCPGGPAQAGAFSEAQFKIGTGSLDPCGDTGWPADLFGGPLSANRLTIQDITSFVAPIRRLDQSPGDASFSSRWDLLPGRGILAKFINIQDITALVPSNLSATARPPMFGGAPAFGQTCPYPP